MRRIASTLLEMGGVAALDGNGSTRRQLGGRGRTGPRRRSGGERSARVKG
jgi:hypothetical protein